MAERRKRSSRAAKPPRKSKTSTRGYVALWTCPQACMWERQLDDMSKRPRLGSVFRERSSTEDVEQAPPASETDASPSKRPPSRAGKRVISIYLDPVAWRQL